MTTSTNTASRIVITSNEIIRRPVPGSLLKDILVNGSDKYRETNHSEMLEDLGDEFFADHDFEVTAVNNVRPQIVETADNLPGTDLPTLAEMANISIPEAVTDLQPVDVQKFFDDLALDAIQVDHPQPPSPRQPLEIPADIAADIIVHRSSAGLPPNRNFASATASARPPHPPTAESQCLPVLPVLSSVGSVLPPSSVVRDPTSCPPTPRSRFSQASSALPSPGSFYDDVFNAEEDRPLSPIISGKRKRLQRGGKGRKMTCGRSPTNAALSSSSSTLTPHDVFSQPEDKAVVRRFKALGNKVRGQRKVIEDKERTSGKRKILVIQQHQEAVTKRTNDKTRLDELSEAIKDLKKEFVRQKDKFNESDEVVNRLEREVRDVSAQHDEDVRQLERIIEKVAQLDNII